ncbi:transcription factor LBX1b [Trichomycterus rosablanca]|uniref:transcription factor LBX1b n=1 Tax=Trichomycterus rosablanca TaxID=2290929 RepID=UPI002F34FDCA
MASTVVKISREIKEGNRRNPLERLPPPASSNKPLTPFSIADILAKPINKTTSAHLSLSATLLKTLITSPVDHTSPLCALQELTSKTFRGLEPGVFQAAEGRDGFSALGQRSNSKKRRKSRTAFTHHQIYELEKRFMHQKYLSPTDRDQVAQQLALTNAQVITWFQNRRAKLKRDLEELKADVESARAVGTVTLEQTAALAELERSVEESKGPSGPEWPSHIPHKLESMHTLCMSPYYSQQQGYRDSEDDDVEIDVDD